MRRVEIAEEPLTDYESARALEDLADLRAEGFGRTARQRAEEYYVHTGVQAMSADVEREAMLTLVKGAATGLAVSGLIVAVRRKLR